MLQYLLVPTAVLSYCFLQHAEPIDYSFALCMDSFKHTQGCIPPSVTTVLDHEGETAYA